MVDNLEFTIRIKKVMNFHQLTASMFADKIGVQRSSISHILSGRNKPSLDFVLKITSKFKDVEIDWLLHGAGFFPKKVESKTTPPTPTLFTSNAKNEKKIQRIVVFYNDGTFEEYKK